MSENEHIEPERPATVILSGVSGTIPHGTSHESGKTPISLCCPRPLVILLVLLALGLICAGFLYHSFVAAPRGGNMPLTLLVPEGATVRDIATILEENGVIRSAWAFRQYLIFSGRDRTVVPGRYLFTEPDRMMGVARRITTGDHGITTIRVTFPEGMTNAEFAHIAASALHLIDEKSFLKEAGPEGYLFPDTYFFYDTATSGDVVAALRENFTEQTADLKIAAEEKSTLSWSETVVLASIVEEEAATAEDRRIVAGILLKRLREGMRLQVDATFAYTLGKGSLQLSEDDLADKDDPYNTYRHTGLPPGAITNPGRDALAAVVSPVNTDYLYYLSDKDGVMHYAKTFDEHKKNKEKYLP